MTTATETRPRGRPARLPERRQDVLRAAARLFSLQGFRQATLEDIAQALDMTRPALYYYARSKDELLAQCAAIADEHLLAALAKSRAETTGLAQIQVFFEAYAEAVCDDFGRCFVLTDRSEMAPSEREHNRAAQLMLGRAIADMIKKGIRDRSIKRCDPVDASRMLFGVFNGMARWYRPGSRRKPGKIAREMLAMISSGLAA